MMGCIFLFVLFATTALAEVASTIVLLPKAWDRHSDLPISIWLHGYGANPSRLTSDPHYQQTADVLGIAIIGVPATRRIGEDSFVWTDIPELDLEHIDACLAEAKRVTGATFGSCALFGFSQGAVVAAEIAARYPNRFVGAIVLSPGSDAYPMGFDRMDGNARQRYFISTGALEHPGNLDFARRYRRLLLATGAAVEYREVPGMKEHNRPPDWPDRYREWTATMLNLSPK